MWTALSLPSTEACGATGTSRIDVLLVSISPTEGDRAPYPTVPVTSLMMISYRTSNNQISRGRMLPEILKQCFRTASYALGVEGSSPTVR